MTVILGAFLLKQRTELMLVDPGMSSRAEE